jgi:tRNA(fMet)-specific endonuclease VapC
MRYLLDTNVVIALLSGQREVTRRVRAHPAQDFGLSVVVTHELYFGAFRSQQLARDLDVIEGLPFETVALDKEDARLAAAIKAELASDGNPIGPYDLFIAAQARSRDLTLITHNVGEFRRVPDLRWEDWQR